MKKIRVLQIIRGLDIGGNSGGAEFFGVKLAQELCKDPAYQVSICAFYSIGTPNEVVWQRKLESEGCETFFVAHWGGGIITLYNFYAD